VEGIILVAGSFNHVVTSNGSLASNKVVVSMLENGGDVFQAVEEMYGMIWYMALGATDPAALIEEARQHYKEGLTASPTKRYKED
jgi:hypothetical protein